MENASEKLKHLRVVDAVEMGRTVGTGAYGHVEEVRFNGLKCAGKKLDYVFLNQTCPDNRRWMLSRFVEECVM